MNSIKILITGSGAPGIMGTIYSLINNFDNRKIEIVGTDSNSDVVGKYLCDRFFVIPMATHTDQYLNSLLDICINEKIEIIVPQNTVELSILSENKKKFEEIGTKILISNKKAIEDSNNKYELMKICNRIGVPTPDFYLVDNNNKLIEAAKKLGWPERCIVIKPPKSNGLRGVRIIDENIDYKKLFYEEKPNNLFTKMEYLKKILGESFPDLIVSEYLPGDEYTVDVLNTKSGIIVIPRKRDLIRSGITFNGTTVYNREIINYSEKLTKEIGLNYCFGFQFKLSEKGIPNILECNPRVQGTMVLSTFAGANIIYGAVKHILGENIPEFEISWETKLLRYWGGVGIQKNKNVLYL